jgi:uncharacterized protein (DUF1800 family)
LPCASASTTVTPAEASRFLSQATLGADWEEIQRTSRIGLDDWLDEQFAAPIGYHEPPLLDIARSGVELEAHHRRWVWWQQIMHGPDPLRQRVALALSEIFVVSDEMDTVGQNPLGLASYYDMLLENAFGNYRDLLLDVSLHPIMGIYLSHLRNQRSNPAQGLFPDENYAREIMQLFSIGLFELRPDGTERLDGAGQPIPTYTNDDITELAKIFTGLSFASPSGEFDGGLEVWNRPMRMYEDRHEPGGKHLLRGKYVPPGQPGMRDIEDAIDNLFEHPNVAPFFVRRLIQRLVTSNPSPAYIERMARVFADNGHGVRGDLRAVVRAILLDPEARDWPSRGEIGRGMLRESFLRRVQLARAFDAKNLVRTFPLDDGSAPTTFGQRPLSSPTVFNFFLPDHKPRGPIGDADLFAPEFQILTAVTAISSANEMQTQIESGMNFEQVQADEVQLDLGAEIALAANAPGLLDRLDLLLMYGNMSARTRQIILAAVEQLDDPVERAHMALYLVAISPEYSVLK